jgi:hypothetical protein
MQPVPGEKQTRGVSGEQAPPAQNRLGGMSTVNEMAVLYPHESQQVMKAKIPIL